MLIGGSRSSPAGRTYVTFTVFTTSALNAPSPSLSEKSTLRCPEAPPNVLNVMARVGAEHPNRPGIARRPAVDGTPTARAASGWRGRTRRERRCGTGEQCGMECGIGLYPQGRV